ncbi:hypothetical protein Tco_0486655 [Tanacetum coccineum]
MHTIMVPLEVKTLKIQAEVQVLRPGELRRHLQLWKRFGRLYLCCIEPDRTLYVNYVTMVGVDIDTLTMEQYLALSRDNQAPCVVKPKIRGNVNFEIKSQFMRELREDTFLGNKDEDAHDYIDRVLNIVGLFNIPGVSKDAFMLRVFPFTLTGVAKRWVDRLAP